MTADIPPSPDSLKVARDAFNMPGAPESRVVSHAFGVMKTKRRHWPYSLTRLLLQAAHQVNTRT